MRTGPIPETMLEAAALVGHFAPRALFDTLLATGLAQTLMVGSRLGIFEALRDGPRSAGELAERCSTHPAATEKLLGALVGASYLRRDRSRYALTTASRRWLLRDADRSLEPLMDLMFIVWRWLEHYETYVRTGQPLDVHRDLDEEGWRKYQRGMRALAGLVAPEVGLRTPVPRGARKMLDIGGSHGFFSVSLCRRHPRLEATVLDLPEAVVHARPLLGDEGLGDRVSLREGDARDADLGEGQWDVILVANLMHHFDDAMNRDLVTRAAKALRPGGNLVVQDVMRPSSPEAGGQVGALGDLYFAALSAAGTYSYEEIAEWQRAAGLKPKRPTRFLTYPGAGQQVATKS